MTLAMTIRDQERQRVGQLLQETRTLPHEQRVKKLEDELAARLVEAKLLAVESLEALSGWSSERFDPRLADDDVVDEVSLIRSARGVAVARTERDLEFARDVSRALAQENEYAIGALNNRVNYAVGTGLRWSLVPLDPDNEDKAVTAQVNGALERVLESVDPDGMPAIEQESLRRGDRDGESIIGLSFPAGPMIARFIEPEDIKKPLGSDFLFGVETAPDDVRTVLAYHHASRGRLDAGDVVHLRMNVDLNSRRGWPTFWPIRRNLARAEKLLRNMSYVAALQAAIALIRKHEVANRTEIEAFVAAKADVTLRSAATGKTESSTFARPGSVWDAGPGMSYEAPVSSVNASNNVLVLGAELRACAARMNMPEFMFSGDASNNDFASALVAEGPSVKGFEVLQGHVGRPHRRIVKRGLEHEEARGAIGRGLLARYKLVVSFPGLTVRERLQESQSRQIQQQSGVLSRLTWRKLEGLDDQVEERNLTLEERRGYAVRGEAPANGETNKPPGQQPGDAAGGSAKADPANPSKARAEL